MVFVMAKFWQITTGLKNNKSIWRAIFGKKGKQYRALTIFFLALILAIYQLGFELFSHKRVLGEMAETGFEAVEVAEVIDGDTIKLSDGRRLRYIGIDAPETKHPKKGKECYGDLASEKNKSMVLNKIVYLEKDVSETDRYGRLLRYVWLDQNTMLNEQLVLEGYALAVSYPPDVKYQDRLRLAQELARDQGHGLWSACLVEND